MKGGKLIGQGEEACVVTNPDDDATVIKIYRSTLEGMREEIDISRILREMDPLEKRFVAPHDFRYVSLDDLKKTPFYDDFTECMRENRYHDSTPRGVVLATMTKLIHPPLRFSPMEREHLEDSVRILNTRILHNDIHPKNIMMRGSFPVLIDFGHARMGRGDEQAKLSETYLFMRDQEEKLRRAAERTAGKKSRRLTPDDE